MKIEANTPNRIRNKIMKKAVKNKKSPDITKQYRLKAKIKGMPITDYFFLTIEKRDRFIQKHEFESLKIY